MNNFRRIFLSIVFCFFISLPSFAGSWDYILNNYEDGATKTVVKKYLKSCNKTLKKNWSTPLDNTINSRSVVFYINKDGSVSDVKLLKLGQTATQRFDKYLYTFLDEIRFEPFPKEIREDKIKMGYVFSGAYQKFFTTAPVVYHWSKQVFRDETVFDSK